MRLVHSLPNDPDNAPVFAEEANSIWNTLFVKQLPQIERWACSDYLEGFSLLGLNEDRIPTLEDLNAQITPRTGWETVRTSIRYTDAVPWYHYFSDRKFLVTDYLRSKDDLEFTPEPDLFHDIFGHLPFFTLPHYAKLQEIFAPVFLRTDEEHRDSIKRLAWYSSEFALIREHGELKAFGAGLISSIAELASVMDGSVPLLPFTIDNVITHDKSVWSHNDVIFIIESIDDLTYELERYFKGLPQVSEEGEQLTAEALLRDIRD